MSNTITLQQLENNLKTWRKQRQIDEKSTAEAQYNWYLKEREELKDAIGDMAVCLINAKALADKSFKLRVEYYNRIEELKHICNASDISLDECLAMAWSEIEHRVGLTREDGFHKWKDLTHAERLQVAESGQLNNMPSEKLKECLDLCSKEEIEEIEEIMIATNS